MKYRASWSIEARMVSRIWRSFQRAVARSMRLSPKISRSKPASTKICLGRLPFVNASMKCFLNSFV